MCRSIERLPVASGEARVDDGSFSVAWVDMDAPAEPLGTYLDLLSDQERARSAQYRFRRDAERFIVRRGHLRILLGGRLGVQPAEITIAADVFGKPSVPGSALGFSLSRSRNVALYAFALDVSIGCDIEWCDPDFASEATARRFFAPEEVDELQRLTPQDRVAGFFACWTRKEAYLKALGLGLSVPLDSFAVPCGPAQPVRFVRGGEGFELHPLSLLPDFAAAVSVATV
jgi:4'-phosphopantetheinyl transferase